jgi:hypothetical protein
MDVAKTVNAIVEKKMMERFLEFIWWLVAVRW